MADRSPVSSQSSWLVLGAGTGVARTAPALLSWPGPQPASSVALREAFSRQLSRRPELLPRWARHWSHRAAQEPDQQIAAILTYLETLASSESPKTITWREVIGLQAVFELSGRGELAEGLSPANWLDRFRHWQEVRPVELPHVPRPDQPP